MRVLLKLIFLITCVLFGQQSLTLLGDGQEIKSGAKINYLPKEIKLNPNQIDISAIETTEFVLDREAEIVSKWIIANEIVDGVKTIDWESKDNSTIEGAIFHGEIGEQTVPVKSLIESGDRILIIITLSRGETQHFHFIIDKSIDLNE